MNNPKTTDAPPSVNATGKPASINMIITTKKIIGSASTILFLSKIFFECLRTSLQVIAKEEAQNLQG